MKRRLKISLLLLCLVLSIVIGNQSLLANQASVPKEANIFVGDWLGAIQCSNPPGIMNNFNIVIWNEDSQILWTDWTASEIHIGKFSIETSRYKLVLSGKSPDGKKRSYNWYIDKDAKGRLMYGDGYHEAYPGCKMFLYKGLTHWTDCKPHTTGPKNKPRILSTSTTHSSGPLVVNSSDHIYAWNGKNWSRMPGLAKDIGAGANGTIWVIGTNPVPGGFGIYQWNGRNWVNRPGGAVRIDVGPNGAPWVVNDSGRIFQWVNGAWAHKPGLAKDIGIGSDGSVWVIGTNAVAGGYGIYKWNGANWANVAGGAVRIDVGANGVPWVVNTSGNIFKWAGKSWQKMPGRAKDIGIGATGAWVIGTNVVNGGYGIYQWKGTNWKNIPGGAVQVSVPGH